MRTLRSFIILLLALNVLLGAGLVVYAVATGRLNRAKVLAAMQMLRHRHTPPHLVKNVAALWKKRAPAPPAKPAATAAAAVVPSTFLGQHFTRPASSKRRLALVRQAMELENLRLEHAAQELRLQQKLLDKQRGKTQFALASITKKAAAFKKAVAAEKTGAHNAAFKRTLSIYRHMQPRQLKTIFMGLPPQQVASYLSAMSSQHAAKVVAQFSSRQSATFIRKVLQLMRPSGTPSAINNSVAATSVGGGNPG